MTYKYFIGVVNVETLKAKYKELARQLHPDVNKASDATAQFQAMIAEYQYIQKSGFVTYPISNGRAGRTFDDIMSGFDAFRQQAERTKQQDSYTKTSQQEHNFYQNDIWEEAAKTRKTRRKRNEEARKEKEEAAKKDYERMRNDPNNFWNNFDSFKAKASQEGFDNGEDYFWLNVWPSSRDYVGTIDFVIDMMLAGGKPITWLLAEVFKLKDLEFNTFKYIRWAIKKRGSSIGLDDSWARTTYQNYITIWQHESV